MTGRRCVLCHNAAENSLDARSSLPRPKRDSQYLRQHQYPSGQRFFSSTGDTTVETGQPYTKNVLQQYPEANTYAASASHPRTQVSSWPTRRLEFTLAADAVYQAVYSCSVRLLKMRSNTTYQISLSPRLHLSVPTHIAASLLSAYRLLRAVCRHKTAGMLGKSAPSNLFISNL